MNKEKGFYQIEREAIENKKAVQSKLITKAASFARCQQLTRLHMVIENQKTITTKSLARIVGDLEEDSRRHATYLRKLCDEI